MPKFGVLIRVTVFLFCIYAKSYAQAIVTGPVSGSIGACEGTASVSPNIARFTVAGNKLTGNINVAAPLNFEVSFTAGGGYSNSLILTPNNGSVSNTVIYIRSSALSPAGTGGGNVTLTSPGAATQMVAVTGTINALATVDPVANQIVINNETATAVHFTGTGSYFKWVNDNPGINLPASGAGDIGSFIATNTGSTPVTATITATPYFAGSVYVANEVYSDVSVINTLTNKIITRIKVGIAPESVTVSPDGSMVYFGNMYSGTISVINTRTNTVVATVPADVTPWGLSISPDGGKLYVAGAYGRVLVMDALTYKTIAQVTAGVGDEGIAASPDGKYVYISGGTFTQGLVFVMSTATNSIITSIPVQNQPIGIAVTPDNSEVYVANYSSGTVSAINTTTNKVVATIPVGINPTGVTISPDGRRAYAAVENANSVVVINTATNQLEKRIPVGQQPFGVSFSPDGTTLYAVNAYSCNVSVIDATYETVTDSILLEGYMDGPDATGSFVTAGMCSGKPVTFTITVNPTPPPALTVESEPGPLTTTYGTPSAPASFNVSASHLKSVVSVNPPPGFELSADGKTFAPSITIGQGLGFGTTPVYIRLEATTPVGSYSGNIVLTATGVTPVSVAMPVSTVSPAPLTIIADDKIKVYLSDNPPLTASYKGFVNGETTAVLILPPVLVTSAVTSSPIGQYPIMAGNAAALNYAITYAPGILTIVKSLTIPNAFTPNGDGVNDTWNIRALAAYANCSVNIFNRWGLKVYSSTGYPIPWDGTFKGSSLPPGTYYYIIDLKNGVDPLAGFVTIVR